MKPIRLIFAASVALAASHAAFALERLVAIESDAEFNTLTWVNQYYKNPQPERLAKRVHVLSRMGYFDQDGQTAQTVGFFASIFSQHPEKVDHWVSQFRDLPVKHQRLLASAVWLSGHPRGASLLKQLSANSESATLASLIDHSPAPIADAPVLSASSMNLHWGAFLASGDERHVTTILAAVGSKTPGIADSARMSLAVNATQDERVLAICRAQLDKQPNAVREVLRAAINEAETNRKPAS